MKIEIVEQSAELIGASFSVARAQSGGFVPMLEDTDRSAERLIERSGRVCWKSEGKMAPGSAAGFLDRVLKQFGHRSIAEHASATVWFLTDRIVSHQLVRHRIAAYSQESTHYINYAKRGVAQVLRPIGLRDGEDLEDYLDACQHGFETYERLIERGYKHYTARYALPMGLKTEIVSTFNFSMWQHVLRERTHDKNTPEIRDLMFKAGNLLAELSPTVFGEWAGRSL